MMVMERTYALLGLCLQIFLLQGHFCYTITRTHKYLRHWVLRLRETYVHAHHYLIVLSPHVFPKSRGDMPILASQYRTTHMNNLSL